MSYEDLLQELLKMTPKDRKQNVVMVRDYGANVYHPISLKSYISFSTDRDHDWEIVIH
jgi:hypothetical protein